MCYFLYGGINDDVDASDYAAIMSGRNFKFAKGDEDVVNRGVTACNPAYRITENYCDCETAIGEHNADSGEIRELAELIHALRKARWIKYVLLSKNWWENSNETVECVHIDEIDPAQYLADIADNCLYKIYLYQTT
ncbi:MAG: hypothetical protein QM689_09055 [Oscillospiraceae bacterium]